jgi:holo-[acyl-carrier protein] synthase
MGKIFHGIDLVDCPRIEQMLERHGSHFLDRVFTPTEQEQASVIKNRIERLSGRFAAKEAILKMLGTGWRGKIAWTDIEIINNPLGQPKVTLSGEVKKIASKLDVGEISLSISHTANFVMASATALTAEK